MHLARVSRDEIGVKGVTPPPEEVSMSFRTFKRARLIFVLSGLPQAGVGFLQEAAILH